MEKKPINKHNKGLRTEKIARDELIGLGYLVEQKNWNRFKSKDFYGLFDILAINGSAIRLIQIKSNKSDFNPAVKKIKEWKYLNRVNINCEVWLYEGRDRMAKKNIWKIQEVI